MTRSSFDGEQLQAGFWVADWYVEPLMNCASRNGARVAVEPKVMEVLLCLAQNAGKTVTKERFMEQVWADTVVTEDVLSRCISELRKVFGDDSRDPRFIETIRKTGYRLIAPVALDRSDVPAEELSGSEGNARPFPASPATLGNWLGPKVRGGGDRHLPKLFVPAGVVLLLAVIGGSVWIWNIMASDPVAPPTTMPFTSYPGQEIEPVFSPDGNQVAFAWDSNTGRDFDLYVKQAGADPPLRITDEQADEHSPAWSPDGLHLAFVRSDGPTHGVYVVPPIGGSERRVVDFGERKVEGITWSPSGDVLVVSAQRAPHDAYALYRVRLDRASVRPLTDPLAYVWGDRMPAFSPDGRHLAFTRHVDEGIADLYVMAMPDGEPERLTHDEAPITGVDWTLDGKDIVFASQREGASGLWRVSASGGEPEWMATAGEGVVFQDLAVAHQGTRLAYVQRTSNANIWRLQQQDSFGPYRAHRLITSTRWDSNPQIAPDGNRIAFTSNRSGTAEIWMCDRDGESPVQLTVLESPHTRTPRWSPDGRSLSFVSYGEGNAEVYVVDAEGGTPRRLTTSPAQDAAPSWSRDGQSIYFASTRNGTWQIWKIPAEGGEAIQVTTNGGRMAQESIDGTVLYYVRPRMPGIWQRPVAPGQEQDAGERLVLDTLHPRDWGNWAVGPDGIYYVRRDEDAPMLMAFDPGTEQQRRVAALHNVPGHPSLTVAPDGTWFLYTQVDRDESDILFLEHFR